MSDVSRQEKDEGRKLEVASQWSGVEALRIQWLGTQGSGVVLPREVCTSRSESGFYACNAFQGWKSSVRNGVIYPR
jgi:hypothetical protein